MKYLLPFLLVLGSSLLAIPVQLFANEKAITAAMNVTPLRLELPQGEVATQLQVRNRADENLAIQVRVFEWLQEDGEDRYRPTRDVVVSPSIVSVKPGRAQSFHVVAKADREEPGEKRYRVVIDELPGASKPAAGTSRTTLRLTVPLFVDRDASGKAKVNVSARPGVLRLENVGGQTVRLVNLALANPEGPVPFAPSGTLRYIHGDSWIELDIPPGAACDGMALRLTALADLEKLDAAAEQVCP